MNRSIEATRRHLREALRRDLALYRQYVPSNAILVEYVELTKHVLLQVLEEVFDDQLKEIKARPMSGQAYPNTLFIQNVRPPEH